MYTREIFDIEYVSQQALRFESMHFNEHYNKYFLRDKINRTVRGNLAWNSEMQ